MGRELRRERVLAGANIPLNLAAPATVKFYYDHETHWVTDNVDSVIAVAPGSFQSELGCPGDWDPGCLRSWLEDPDGDGIYTFATTALPAGVYEAKAALDESWDENYGAGGVPGGANIPFTVPTDNAQVTFSYESISHVLTIAIGSAAPRWTPVDRTRWMKAARSPSRRPDRTPRVARCRSPGTWTMTGRSRPRARRDVLRSPPRWTHQPHDHGSRDEPERGFGGVLLDRGRRERIACGLSVVRRTVVRCCTNNARLRVSFSDPGTADPHVASIDWGDGTTRSIDPATSPSPGRTPTHTPGSTPPP